jgi:CheY-like chemotaxis protein
MSPAQRTILVVDDDEDIRSLARAYLEDQGYRVLQAPNGAEGLRVLGSAQVDLLFTDILMPGDIDGFELAERAKQAYPSLRVLYTSGFFKELPRRGQMPPAGAIVPKPWRLAHLDEAVKRAFG